MAMLIHALSLGKDEIADIQATWSIRQQLRSRRLSSLVEASLEILPRLKKRASSTDTAHAAPMGDEQSMDNEPPGDTHTHSEEQSYIFM